MPRFAITSNKVFMYIEAGNLREAWKKFFKKVREKNLISEIGHIAILTDERKRRYIFRTVPALYAGGAIDRETAILNIMHILKVSREEAENMLDEFSKKDSWVWA